MSTAQTLSAGDIVFISFKTSSNSKDGFFTLFARKPIPANTTIKITNKYYRSNTTPKSFSNTSISSYTSTAQGEITILFNEPVSVGQSFQVVFSEANSVTTVTSTVGQCSFSGNAFDFGNTDNDRVIWLYEPVTNSDVNIVTAIMYSEGSGNNEWSDFHSTPPNTIVFSQLGNTSYSNVTALNLGINGSSQKCGAWTQYQGGGTTVNTTVDLNADLKNTFYKKADWIATTSNSIDPCSASSVASGVQSWLESNVSFPKKLRYGFNGALQWEDYSSGTWTNITEPSWSSNTYKDFEINLYRTYYLDSSTVNAASNASASTKNFECAKLRLVNKFNSAQPSAVKLILGAGAKLTVHYSVNMIDSNNVIGSAPSVRLESAHIGGFTHFAQIAPTSATLNGTYTYHYQIRKAGWHHLQSPISATFSSIGITPLSGSSSTFAFTPGAAGVGNFFKWNASTSQWSQGATTDNFSSEPYSIYLATTEVPVQLSITGTLVNSDQDAISNAASAYHNPSTSGSFGNVPGWTSDGSDGWNFYGNPYLSSISTQDLLGYFSNSGSNSSNKMTGLQNKIYVWQPDAGSSNLTSNYLNRSYDGTTHTGDAAAAYLAPFQAFFMRCASSGNAGNSNGFTKSKKYRSVVSLSSSNSVSNKTDMNGQYSLGIINSQTGKSTMIYLAASPYGSVNYQPQFDLLESSSSSSVFAFAIDSHLYRIKYLPALSDSMSVDVLHADPANGTPMTISTKHEQTLLLDRHTNQIHSFKNGSYSFFHSTQWNGAPRFKWYVNESALDEAEVNGTELVVRHGSDFVAFSHPGLKYGSIINLLGQKIMELTNISDEVVVSCQTLTPGIYVFQSNIGIIKFLIK